MKLLLTGGGTAGHILPCLALLPYLKNDFDEIHYIGSAGGMEKQLAGNNPDLIYHEIPCVKLVRSLTPKNFAIPFKLSSSVKKARTVLREIEPDVIFSKGGYVALPVVMAHGNVPVVAHESDYTLGLANKLIYKRCEVFCCGFKDTADSLSKGVFTGIPLRRELYGGKKQEFFAGKKPVLLVFGGSLGAKSINDMVLNELPEIKKFFDVIHVVGKSGVACREEGYVAITYTEKMADLYASADYVLSRGGATALCEIISLKKPALIIPLGKSGSRGDQQINADYYYKQGLIETCAETEAAPILPRLLALTRDNALKTRLLTAKAADGSEAVARIIIDAAKRFAQNRP